MRTNKKFSRNVLETVSILLLVAQMAFSQQWSGNNNTTDPIGRTGNVGVGITSPVFPLQVRGNSSGTGDTQLNVENIGTGRANIYVSGGNSAIASLIFRVSGGASKWQMGKHADNTFFMFDVVQNRDFFRVNSSGHMLLQPVGGNVLVGKTSQTNSTYILDINGKVRSSEIVVNTTGADFVFDKNYSLMPLSQLEQYIVREKKLPEIPSAKEMQENGLAVGEMQTKLLQKIEELTLYIIELNKENYNLKQHLTKLEKQ